MGVVEQPNSLKNEPSAVSSVRDRNLAVRFISLSNTPIMAVAEKMDV